VVCSCAPPLPRTGRVVSRVVGEFEHGQSVVTLPAPLALCNTGSIPIRTAGSSGKSSVSGTPLMVSAGGSQMRGSRQEHRSRHVNTRV
jgi:hypothetical protein